ncbi:hypothetical protein [Kitasatospora sp. NPDC017646]|uniref:hypothetical protein n=1 Tax=Kitasatospora sp. NPDC017646 TaxID=3364024 RepID=UPI0037B8159B
MLLGVFAQALVALGGTRLAQEVGGSDFLRGASEAASYFCDVAPNTARLSIWA